MSMQKSHAHLGANVRWRLRSANLGKLTEGGWGVSRFPLVSGRRPPFFQPRLKKEPAGGHRALLGSCPSVEGCGWKEEAQV